MKPTNECVSGLTQTTLVRDPEGSPRSKSAAPKRVSRPRPRWGLEEEGGVLLTLLCLPSLVCGSPPSAAAAAGSARLLHFPRGPQPFLPCPAPPCWWGRTRRSTPGTSPGAHSLCHGHREALRREGRENQSGRTYREP